MPREPPERGEFSAFVACYPTGPWLRGRMPLTASPPHGLNASEGSPADHNATPAVGSVILFDSHQGNDGHRAEYYALLSRLIGARRTASLAKAMFGREPVLVGALEASGALLRYAVLALVRAALGRRTAALLFRPLPALAATDFKLRFKRSLLGWIRRMRTAQTLTILPFSLEPGFARIASGWIYDPQFWDLHYPEAAPDHHKGSLATELRERAGMRRICCAIGRQDKDKGFDQFVAVYCQRPDLRESWLFAVGGTVDPALDSDAEALVAAGGMVLPRFIKQDELLDLYASADLIWCSYDPNYDQASGIFGRAKQLGIPVVVRTGSLIHRYCRNQALPHLAYSGDPSSLDLTAIPTKADPSEAARRARAEGRESLQRLKVALGLD
jgi:hypothetical protein